VNPGYTRRIVGYKDEESEYLLKFLFDHISKGADFQIRARYEPGTVVVWVRTLRQFEFIFLFFYLLLLLLLNTLCAQDNRLTVHSATHDLSPTIRRHAGRLTPQAEPPTEEKVNV
jgi:sulfonate dioxygenase